MKTPMQELISRLDYLIGLSNDTLYEFGLKAAKKEAEQILEKEKEMMCQFADEFAIECINFHHEKTMSQEQFFNLTFNTKEE